MPVNAHPEYLDAEKEYHNASTNEEKQKALEKMVRFLPTHKGAENLRKNIRSRLKKLKQEILIKAKKKTGSQKSIRKADQQAILIGPTNTGKSSLLKALTNAQPKIASYGFTTQEPEIGTLKYEGADIQLIELPPVGSEAFDHNIVNSADILLIVIEKIHELKSALETIKNKTAKKIIVFTKSDLHDSDTKRKITATLRTKKYTFTLTSTKTDEGLAELKEKIFKSCNIIRVYTRQPGKKEDSAPVILPPNITIKKAALKILHGYATKVTHAKIWGPSAKFQGQQVGLKHILKDKDIVELYTE